MVFSNVAFDYGNVSLGPIPGRVYSIHTTNNVLYSKTFPASTNLQSYPTDIPIAYTVKQLAYDGFYFWTLSWIGNKPNNGVYIEKWYLYNNVVLQKQFGAGSSIFLTNSSAQIYDSSAFCIRTVDTTLSASAGVGSTSVVVSSAQYFEINDTIYLGPSSMFPGMREERVITGLIGNTVYFNTPLVYGYNNLDKVSCRKEIWLFNNKVGTSDLSGSLISYNSSTGSRIATKMGTVWQGVSAACSYQGKVAFVKGTQLLQYRPEGESYGLVSSLCLNNIKADKNTIITVHGVAIDDVTILKSQLERVVYNNATYEYEDEASVDNKYNIDVEYLTNSVKTITLRRDVSQHFGISAENQYVVQVRDQYDIPVFNCSITIQEDDTSGFIKSGYNSFVTDSDGLGTTYYNSGLTPLSRLVKLSVSDLASGYRRAFNLDQLRYSVMSTFVRQYEKRQNINYVDSLKTFMFEYIDQALTKSYSSYVDQQNRLSDICYVEDAVTKNSMSISQRERVTDVTNIDQSPIVSSYVDLNQYIFLIFAIPTPYSIKNDPYTDILVRIAGFGAAPLNINTLVFRVNGINVANQVQVSPFSGGLELIYNPVDRFAYDSRVSVYISIYDNQIPPRKVETNYTFDITQDYRRPSLESVYPPDQSVGNSSTTDVYCTLIDLETGVDLSSIRFYFNGKLVDHTISIEDNNKVKVIYKSPVPLLYGIEHFASVYMEDNSGNYNIGSWSFFVKESSGIYVHSLTPNGCSTLVPIDANVCAEIFGNEDGVNIDTLTFDVDGRPVSYVLRPKVLKL